MTASGFRMKEQVNATVAAVSAKPGKKARMRMGIEAPWTKPVALSDTDEWTKKEEQRILTALEAMKRAEYDRKHTAIKLEKRARQSAIKGWTKVAIKNAIQDDFFAREERLKQT